jgi:uncharacterized membrane protein
MVRISSGAFHEKLTAGKEDIILNGPPADLRGHIFISNKNTDTLKVKSLPIMHGKNFIGNMDTDNVLRLSCRLNPGEEKLVEIWHQLHPLTAPGTYESILLVGGEKRKVKMVVQQQIEIDIQPASFTFLGTEPGKTHTVECTLTNLGNIPFQIPDVKHVAAVDMDMLCRAFGVAMRNNGAEGYEQMLNEVSKNMQSNLPDWAKANVKESGVILQPGEKILLHIDITLPKNCDAQKDYSGDIRIWDKDISYTIKSHVIKTK